MKVLVSYKFWPWPWIALLCFISMCLGYSWRYQQEVNREQLAFSKGLESCLHTLVKEPSETYWYEGDFKVTRFDEKVLVIKDTRR